MDLLNKELIFSIVLIVLVIGTVVWVVRQVLPKKIEDSKLWKILLKVVPPLLGIAIALIPGLRPVDDPAQCGALGFVSGSFAQLVYGLVREAMPDNIRAWLGSRAKRINGNGG